MTPTNPIVPVCIFCGPCCRVGYGHCHCKCGGKTKHCTMTSLKFGVTRGLPCKYILGHQGRIRPTIEKAVPFKIEGVYCRLISLTKKMYAIVDEDDYRWLMFWKWWAHWDQKGNCFYAVRKGWVDRKSVMVRMHREILGLPQTNPQKGDHKNGTTLDNRRHNLRPATTTENQQNSRKPVTNTSGYKGVSFHKASGKWVAQIMVDGKKKHLGLFATPQLAYAAYCAAALRHHGRFARLT